MLMKKNESLLRLFSKRLALGASLALVATGQGWAYSKAPIQKTDVVTSVMQAITIKGTVMDVTGEPVIGASVVVEGTTNGTITDIDGNFSLPNVPGDAKIKVSYIGYKTKVIKASAVLKVTLEEDSETLDEVVVVGYGVQKKANLTGAVASVDFEEQAKSRPITTVSSALAGLSPGLQASSGSAMPGEDKTTLRVRGVGTMNTSTPLVIIDGMEGTLESINPLDVDNISVLKDAASCAIYGARAANGVILVTTKAGDRDKIRINYSGRISFNSPTRMIEMMSNYADYMELMNESCINVNAKPLFSQKNIDLWREKSQNPNGLTDNGVPNYIAYPNTDWANELFSGGMMHDHNLSVTGGSEKIRFLLSAGYQDNQGVVDNTANKRYSVRANIEANPTKWLTVGTRTYASQMDRQVGDFENANTFLRQSTAGTYPKWNGSFGYPECSEERATSNNPLYKLARNDGFKRYNRFNTTLYSKIKFFKDLSWDFNLNYNRYIYETRQWGVPAYQTRFSDGVIVDGITPPSQLSTSFDYESNYSYTLENLVNYHHTFAQKHDVSALVGYQEFYKNYYKVNAAKKGLIDESLNQFDQATDMTKIGGETQDYATRSVFGRVNYSYNSRYLFEANFRYDGSSRFHKDHRWGFFPSLSAGWRISEETFMESTRSWLDNLKIRASWGKLGNSEINNYEYQASYGTSNYVFGNALSSGLAITSFANELLQWESTNTTNFGIDVGMLNNRLTASIDIYHKKTTGILYRPTMEYVLGYHNDSDGNNVKAPRQNIAEVSNNGIEFSLGWQDKIGKVSYSVNGNFAYNRNKVDKYKGEYVRSWAANDANKLTGGKYTDNIGLVSSGGNSPIVEGHMMNEYYYRSLYKGNGQYFNGDGSVNPTGGPQGGMIRTEDDMNWVKSMIAAGYKFKPGNAVGNSKIWYGDYIYADANGDGVYGDDDDAEFQGRSNTPKINFGFQASASWNNFDISMVWAGAAGFDIYWGPTSGYNASKTEWGNNIAQRIADNHYFYDPKNPDDPRTNLNAKYPRMTYLDGNVQNNASSNRWLYKGDYVKLKNLSLGYTLPQKWVTKIAMQNARIYVSGENLLTITSFEGQDPESATGMGYAPFRTIAIGANITF